MKKISVLLIVIFFATFNYSQKISKQITEKEYMISPEKEYILYRTGIYKYNKGGQLVERIIQADRSLNDFDGKIMVKYKYNKKDSVPIQEIHLIKYQGTDSNSHFGLD